MTNEITPEPFIELIKARCPAGFNQLYEKHSSWLYGICLHALKSESVAEEILELSFLNIYSQINSYQPEKMKFHCWMLTIVVKTVKNYYESKDLDYCFTIEKFPYFTAIPIDQTALSTDLLDLKLSF